MWAIFDIINNVYEPDNKRQLENEVMPSRCKMLLFYPNFEDYNVKPFLQTNNSKTLYERFLSRCLQPSTSSTIMMTTAMQKSTASATVAA